MKRASIAGVVALLVAAATTHAQDDPAMAAFLAHDGTTARRLWEPRAAAGEYEAQSRLGMLLTGATAAGGIEPDLTAARGWLGQAAAQRDRALADRLDQRLYQFAQVLATGRLEQALGPVDDTEITAWYEMAADLGHREAGVEFARRLLPPPLPGWSRGDCGHALDTEPAAVTRRDDAVSYPVTAWCRYAHEEGRAAIDVGFVLNHADTAAMIREGVAQFTRVDEEIIDRSAKRDEPSAHLTARVGDYTAVWLMDSPERKIRHSYSVLLDDRTAVRSVMHTDSGDPEADRVALLAFLRIVDLERLARATAGHGVSGPGR